MAVLGLAGFTAPAVAQAVQPDPEAPPPKTLTARTWWLSGAAGVSQRVDQGEGRTIPLLALAYRNQDFLGTGWRFDAQYVTTWFKVEARSPLPRMAGGKRHGFFMAAGGETEIQSGLQTPYRYVRGDYLRRRLFYTTYGGLNVAGGWVFDSGYSDGSNQRTEARLSYQLRRYWFEDAPDTQAGFLLPDNHVEHRIWFDLVIDERRSVRAGEIWNGWGLWFSAGHALREKWRNWGDTPDTLLRNVRRYQEYEWVAAAAGWWQHWKPRDQHLHAELGVALGDDLDRISGFGVGSVYATFPYTWASTGYYYGEFKADRLLLLNADYSFDLNRYLRPYFYLDTGLVRAIGERTRWKTGIGVGMRFGIPVGDQLLPILLRYGYAPRAQRGTKSRGGHELALRILFAL